MTNTTMRIIDPERFIDPEDGSLKRKVLFRIGRPGYFGQRLNDINKNYDLIYGSDCWQIVWKIDKNFCPKKEAIELYEDAYYEYFKNNPEKLDWLVKTASNVYDTSPTNINSGFDYSIQEADSSHLQDIAIRRCMVRLGVWFKGNELIEVRSSGRGAEYSPGNIPFHRLDLIAEPQLKGWWQHGSVESFYQSNKFLEVADEFDEEEFIAGMTYEGENFFSMHPRDPYGEVDVWFATGNSGKFNSALAILNGSNIKVKQIALDITEPYDDVRKNAKHKALTAFSVLCRPVICDDSALIIPSLGGWPGANVKRVLQEIKLEGFLRKLKDTNREARFDQALTYVDWNGELHLFEEQGDMGIFAEKPRGTLKPWHKSELMQIFIRAKERNKKPPKTIAEIDEKEYFDKKSERWEKFIEFYKHQKELERMIEQNRLTSDDRSDD